MAAAAEMVQLERRCPNPKPSTLNPKLGPSPQAPNPKLEPSYFFKPLSYGAYLSTFLEVWCAASDAANIYRSLSYDCKKVNFLARAHAESGLAASRPAPPPLLSHNVAPLRRSRVGLSD